MAEKFELPEIANHFIQVNLTYKKGVSNVLGNFQIWRKGGSFGFGDSLMHFCPRNGCTGLIDFSFYLEEAEAERVDGEENISKWPLDLQQKHDQWYNLMVACPKCHESAPRCMYVDSYFFNMVPSRIADRMIQLFEELDHDSDVFLVRSKEEGMFQKAKLELTSVNANLDEHARLLARGRDREQAFYPLKKLKQDVASGSLHGRFLSLLTS